MNNTEIDLLKPLLLLINLIFISCVMAFGYLLLEDQLKIMWTKPPALNPSANKSVNSKEGFDLEIKNGIHVASGLIYDDNFELVWRTCTACHSGKIITQNRATREGWSQMIDWMQATQGLWDLGENESLILDYLSKNYAPKEIGRRANINLKEVEWYILDLQ